jgi:hypothetical protein
LLQGVNFEERNYLMKRRNFCKLTVLLLSLNLILTIFLSGCAKKNVETKSKEETTVFSNSLTQILNTDFDAKIKASEGFFKVEDKENTMLYVNGKTAEIAVKQKDSGLWWYSNPINKSEDTLAKGTYAEQLSSQLTLSYIDPIYKTYVYSSAADSVNNKQYGFTKIENGLRITYQFGKQKKVYLAPKAISEERMNKILDKLSEDDKLTLLTYYTLTKFSDITDPLQKQQMKSAYKSIEKTNLYTLFTTQANGSVIFFELPNYQQQMIEDTLKKAGYTENDLIKDYEDNGIEFQKDKNAVITVPMDITLKGEDLVVKVDCKNIDFDRKTFYLSDVNLLPYFGAADTTSKGYIFVPDGSGAIINLNNNKKEILPYKKPLYGRDKTLTTDHLPLSNDGAQNYLPVFGLKQNNSAFLGVIESGDTISNINADISGRNNMFNNVYPSFNTTRFSMENIAAMNFQGINFQAKPAQDVLQVRYLFLANNESDYTGMAKKYRKYLLENGKINKQQIDNTAIPLNVKLLGACSYNTSLFGFSYKGTKSLTTYLQAKNILEKLKENKIDKINLIYKAWFNSGIDNFSPQKIDFINELGSKKNFDLLNQYIKSNNIDFYPDVNVSYVKQSSMFNSFNENTDTAKNLSNVTAYDYDYTLSSKKRLDNTKRFIVNPSSYNKILNNFLKDYKDLNVSGLSLSLLGTDLNSDFNRSSPISRQNAADMVAETLKVLTKQGYKLSVDGANAYSFQSVSNILNTPNDSGNHYLIDETVPFYQIVLHGIIPLASSPMNFSSNYKDDVLKLIETATNPTFEWIYEDNFALKETDYNFYSVNFKAWQDDAFALYNTLNNAFASCQNSAISEHKTLTNGVKKTVFENGTKIYVNYNSNPVNVDGITVDSKNFKVMK